MNHFLWPAIKLMGRLGYAAKFGLMSCLFMAPLIFLSGQVFFDAYQSLRKTEAEYAGFENIEKLVELAHKIEQHRNYISVSDFLTSSPAASIAASEKQAMVDNFNQLKSYAQSYPKLAELLPTYESEFFNKLITDGALRQQHAKEQFLAYQEVISATYVLAHKLSLIHI